MIATGQTLKSMPKRSKAAACGWMRAAACCSNRAAMASIVILALITLLALLAPLLSPFAYDEVNYDIIACAPNWWPAEATCRAPGHIFGTDCGGPRPVRAGAVRRAGVAGGGAGGDPGVAADRRAVWRGRPAIWAGASTR